MRPQVKTFIAETLGLLAAELLSWKLKLTSIARVTVGLAGMHGARSIMDHLREDPETNVKELNIKHPERIPIVTYKTTHREDLAEMEKSNWAGQNR